MWAVQYSQQIAEKLEEGTFPGGTWKDLWSSDRTNGSTMNKGANWTHTASVAAQCWDQHSSQWYLRVWAWEFFEAQRLLQLLPVQSHFHAPFPHSLNIQDCFVLKEFELKHLPQYSVSRDLQRIGAGCSAQESEPCCRGSEGCAQPLPLFCLRNWKILTVPF